MWVTMMMNDELTRLRAELKSMGAPGDYGYGTDTGEALMLAHRIMAVCHTQTARAEAALLASSEEARQSLRQRDTLRAEVASLRAALREIRALSGGPIRAIAEAALEESGDG